MSEAVRSVDVECPIEHMYRVITDFESLPEFVTSLLGVTVDSREDETYRVSYRIRLTKEIQYTLELNGFPPERLEWHLLGGEFIRGNDGAWELEALDGERTRATYRIDLTLPIMVPASVTRNLAEVSLPLMLDEFRVHAEKTWKSNGGGHP